MHINIFWDGSTLLGTSILPCSSRDCRQWQWRTGLTPITTTMTMRLGWLWVPLSWCCLGVENLEKSQIEDLLRNWKDLRHHSCLPHDLLFLQHHVSSLSTQERPWANCAKGRETTCPVSEAILEPLVFLQYAACSFLLDTQIVNSPVKFISKSMLWLTSYNGFRSILFGSNMLDQHQDKYAGHQFPCNRLKSENYASLTPLAISRIPRMTTINPIQLCSSGLTCALIPS